MDYQGIPRAYRPQTFAAVVGQEAIVTTLKNALRLGKIAPAYLFTGMYGTGKTTLARILAKAINCAALTEGCEPCNQCPSCLAIASGRSLDVLEIDGASHRSIEDIRSLNETISYAPALGKNKIYLIDEVHMLTKEAFHALLKTLEEPPPAVTFIFATTEAHKVLPTIVSRCQCFDLHAIPPKLMKERLMYIASDLERECEESVLDLIVYLSEGALRNAESLLDRLFCLEKGPVTVERAWDALGLLSREMFFSLDKAYAAEQLPFAFIFAEHLFASGKDPVYCLSLLLEHYRTILQMHLGVETFAFHPKDRERYKEAHQIYSKEQCLLILDLLLAWQERMAKLPFKRTLVELLLLEILRSKHYLSPVVIAERLLVLEEKIHDTLHVKQTPSRPISKSMNTKQETTKDFVPNSLQNRESNKLEQATIVQTPDASEDTIATETQSAPKNTDVHPSRHESLMRFAAVELEGTLKQK